MNKILLFFVILNFGFQFSLCEDEFVTQLKKKYLQRKYLEEKHGQIDEFCPGYETKIKKAAILAKECMKNVDHSLTMCEIWKKYTFNCTKPIIEAVESCLPADAKGVPSLVVKGILSVVDYFCRQTGESLFELTNPCLWKVLLDDDFNMDKCDKKIEEIENITFKAERPPSQSEVCSAVINFRSCVHHVADSCKNIKTKKAFTGIYDAYIAPCSNIGKE